jgi:hypothetical protein
MKTTQASRLRTFKAVLDAVHGLPDDEVRIVLGAVLELVPPGGLVRKAPFAARVARKARKQEQKCSICGKPGHNAKGHHNHVP